MISELLKSGVPSAHNNTRQRVEGKVDLPRLFRAIDADPAIAGAGVVYIESDFTVVTLREFRVICSIVPKKVVLREAPRHMAPLEFVRILETQPRESRLVAEAVSAGLACSSAILGWITAFSGTVFVPFSAGTSLIVSKIGLAVVAASSAQCIVSGVRAYNEASDPVLNDEMDREDWYRYMMPLLDAISLLGAGISGVATVRLLQARKAATGRNWYELSRGLSRQQQKSLTRELLSIRHPSLTAKQLKLKQRLMEFPKRHTNDQLQHATLTQIKDAVGAALSLAGSAHSGNIKAIAMGYFMNPMMDLDFERKKFKAFMARYFKIFLCSFFLSVFSAACTISLMASTYFRGYPERGRYTIIVAISASTTLTILNYLVVRGRPRAIWGIVTLNVLCLFLVLSLTGNKPHFISYITGIVFPLLSLLALNSKRHREMRSVLVTIRQQREELHRLHKRRGRCR